MKKTVFTTVLYSIFAAVAMAAGVLLCITLSGGTDKSTRVWNMLLSLPRPVTVIAAVLLVTLDVAAIILAATLIVSDIRTRTSRRALKKKKSKPRFSRLAAIDAQKPAAARYEKAERLDLLCERFRNFAASQMGLYYDKDVIRAYIASLAVTRLTVMQGISGTGKTSLAYALGKFLGNDAVMVPVQPSWKDRTDLLGYYNEFTDSYTETELLCKLYEANTNDDVYIAVLDEMNIARVEYYFAEFLSLLELPEGPARRVRVTADSRESDPVLFESGTLRLPGNVWFTGTCNNDDSTLALSDKVFDRAFVIDLEHRAKPFAAPPEQPAHVSASELIALFGEARRTYSLSAPMREKIEALDEYLVREFRITFGNRIMRQIEQFVPVFVSCGGIEDVAVDMMICRKVLRKLESRNPVFVRAGADGLIRRLNELFGADKMRESKEYTARFKEI